MIFNISVIIENTDEKQIENLYQVRDDVTASFHQGVHRLSFDSEAISFDAAKASIKNDLHRLGIRLKRLDGGCAEI